MRRDAHANWTSKKGRNDPVATILAANSDRLRFLLPIKMGRMAASPFAFFRGAAPLMAADLAKLPMTGLHVQICGDAHVRNLGAYAAPEGHLVFDINDFDETIPGPWEWDLKRLATSLVLAGREAGENKNGCRDSVEEMVLHYRTSMNRFASMSVCELARVEIRRGAKGTPVHAVLQKARRVTPVDTLSKLATLGERTGHRFHDRPPVLRHVDTRTRGEILKSLAAYHKTIPISHQWVVQAYQPVDVAFKIVGTGSVGTRDYVVLLFGNGVEDPLILQVKEEVPSCYAAHLSRRAPVKHEGKRVAEAQRRIQTVTDPLLGYTTIGGRHFLVRQLADHKASINPPDLKGTALLEYAAVCGELLAKGHARTGDAGAI
ncbi:MAG: DUF2252 domain-containing protein, partial [Verrucomicrobiota bacterium]|nr:DUF2252 domain-containing protein [Verrucomicrobiota bacterium]